MPTPSLLLLGFLHQPWGIALGAAGAAVGGLGGGGSAHHPVTTKGLPKGSSCLPQGWAGTGAGAEQEVLTDDDLLLQESFLHVNQEQRCFQSTCAWCCLAGAFLTQV